MKVIVKLFYSFLFFSTAICGLAQTYNFKVFTEDNGLPQSYIYNINQGKFGFLNVSTGDGFSVFDGLKFTNYTKKNGLAENNSTCSYTDTKNTTWIGHFQNGISFIENNICYKLKKSDTLDSKVLCFAQSNTGQVFFGTQTKGLFYIDETKKITSVATPNNLTCINKIVITSNNEFVIASNSGLFIYKRISNKLVLKHSFSQFADYDVKDICISEKNKQKLFVITNNVGVSIIDLYKGEIKKINQEQLKLENLSFTSILEDFFGNLWIGTFGEGIVKIDYKDLLNFDFTNISKINMTNNLPSNYIQSLYQGYEGNIWVGTFGSGLVQVPLDKFEYYAVDELKMPGGITSLYTNRNNNLCFGTNKGLYIQNSQTIADLFSKGENVILPQYEITAIIQDSLNNYILGTAKNGVFYYNPVSKKTENFSSKYKISSNNINDIKVSNTNKIIVATTEGVYFVNQHKNTTIHLTTIEGLLHNNVANVFIDSKNRIWYSSNGTPPYYLENNEITSFSAIRGMKGFDIVAVTEDAQKNIWIATQGDGLFKYQNDEFINFKSPDSLLSNFCYSLLPDKFGNLWCTHKNGLSCINIKTNEVQTYKTGKELLFANFNTNVRSHNNSNNVVFGSEKGFVTINNLNQYFATLESKTTIKSLTFNKTTYTNFTNIDLPFDNYNFKVEFVAICLTSPTDVEYKYRILGLDTNWIYTRSRTVELPKLNDGHYAFQLKAKNNYNVWNSNVVEASFSIRDPFYKKWWFYILALIALIGIFYLFIKLRTKAFLEKNLQLETLVNQKTAQLKEEKELVELVKAELQEKNTDLTDSINYALRIQKSVLPSRELLAENFKNHFVLFKPKDIVSGDFYWFAETEENFILVSADCTGHGIPGAFMSLIGNTLLSEIVNRDKTHSPARILRRLNSAVIKLLHQNKAAMSNDGMDMAICSFNKTHTKLTFATAIRPVYIVRDKELIEYKGSKFSIGGLVAVEKVFEDIEVDLQKGDALYLFSDGYTDQFGGEYFKRYTTKRFKEHLATIAHLDCHEQKMLLEDVFDDWRGDKKQIDDVLVIGVKF